MKTGGVIWGMRIMEVLENIHRKWRRKRLGLRRENMLRICMEIYIEKILGWL
jgi:hypothetical protein